MILLITWYYSISDQSYQLNISHHYFLKSTMMNYLSKQSKFPSVHQSDLSKSY